MAPRPLNDSTTSAPLGLIAGQGMLPLITARGLKAAGHRVIAIGLRGQYDESLVAECDEFHVAGITRLCRWIKLIKKGGASQAVMVGRVGKSRMYDRWRYVRDLPDWRAARVWFWRLREDKRTDKMLRALADELAGGGVTLIDGRPYIAEHLASLGVMTQAQPTRAQEGDIAFGLPIVRRLGELDIGQGVVVGNREVIAVEAMEGTDAMIRRAGVLCRRRGWVLLKTAKPNQDMRFDVPTIGVGTIKLLAEQGGGCLAVEAGKVILIDKPAVLQAAEEHHVVIVGIE